MITGEQTEQTKTQEDKAVGQFDEATRSPRMTYAGQTPARSAVERVTLENVGEFFRYKNWDENQIDRGRAVTEACIFTAEAILRNVPECPLRTRCINDLADLRMRANLAITHEGRF